MPLEVLPLLRRVLFLEDNEHKCDVASNEYGTSENQHLAPAHFHSLAQSQATFKPTPAIPHKSFGCSRNVAANVQMGSEFSLLNLSSHIRCIQVENQVPIVDLHALNTHIYRTPSPYTQNQTPNISTHHNLSYSLPTIGSPNIAQPAQYT